MAAGWSEAEKRCRKHLEHKLAKGVCPYCLREKLVHISTSSSSSATSINFSSSASISSPNSDSDSDRRPGRLLATALKKSRSLAFAIGRETERETKKEKKREDNNKINSSGKKKKGRFWYKFIGKGGLLHSHTMKEKSTATKWSFFS